jgi:aminoglycoside phosphotransferase (APT) family kinase protein
LTRYTDLQNILFDLAANPVTALLDFDFTHVASPADEFFYFSPSFYGILSGLFESEENEALRPAQLDGFKKS